MPLNIHSRISSSSSAAGTTPAAGSSEALVVALLNNMPDAALEATEAQFRRLLEGAAGPRPVELRLAYLPEVRRTGAALERVRRAYVPVDELLRSKVDALIVTGLEPVAARLVDEPYWPRIGQLLEWAEAHTYASAWSCLAAHAAVQYLDGIERQRLEHKRCGVFTHELGMHPLARDLQAPLYTPHSRWNDLPMAALHAADYTLVSFSAENGADIFVKQRRTLLLFLQGHPEYEETTLLREYRRDIGRFLRGQQAHYPELPRGYLSPPAQELLLAFRERALERPDPELLASLPLQQIEAGLENRWRANALALYRNWLEHVRAAKHSTARLLRER